MSKTKIHWEKFFLVFSKYIPFLQTCCIFACVSNCLLSPRCFLVHLVNCFENLNQVRFARCWLHHLYRKFFLFGQKRILKKPTQLSNIQKEEKVVGDKQLEQLVLDCIDVCSIRNFNFDLFVTFSLKLI